MLRSLSALSFLVLGTVLPAQSVSGTAQAWTSMTVTANGANTSTQAIPAATSLTAGVLLGASSPGTYCCTAATATTEVTLAQDPSAYVRYTVRDVATAGYLYGGGSAASGPHETLLAVTASQNAVGRLRLRYTGNAPTFGLTAKVDVGNDNTIDWQLDPWRLLVAPVTLSAALIVNLGPAPTLVRTITGATASSGGTAVGAVGVLELEIVPVRSCTATLVSLPCGFDLGAQSNWLAGADVVASNLPAGQPVFVVFGFAPLATTLPLPPGCTLDTDVVAAVLTFTDASGFARYAVDGRGFVGPITFRTQAVHLDVAAGSARTSNALQVVCQ